MPKPQHNTLNSLTRERNKVIGTKDYTDDFATAFDRAERFVNENPNLPYSTIGVSEWAESISICYGSTKIKFEPDGWVIENC